MITCVAARSSREKCPEAFPQCPPHERGLNCHTAAMTLQEYLEK